VFGAQHSFKHHGIKFIVSELLTKQQTADYWAQSSTYSKADVADKHYQSKLMAEQTITATRAIACRDFQNLQRIRS
jgi:hypothetical protein